MQKPKTIDVEIEIFSQETGWAFRGEYPQKYSDVRTEVSC